MTRPAAALPATPAGSGAASPPPQDPDPVPWPAAQTADDDTLAAMYVRMWSLATGRRLPPGVQPDQPSADELIAFWDDVFPVSGRHAAPDAGPAGEAR
jgi:hypothetical protein